MHMQLCLLLPLKLIRNVWLADQTDSSPLSLSVCSLNAFIDTFLPDKTFHHSAYYPFPFLEASLIELTHSTPHHAGISFLFLTVFMVCCTVFGTELYMAFHASSFLCL